MRRTHPSIARYLEPFLGSAAGLRGLDAGLSAALSVARTSRDRTEVQTRLLPLQGAARLRFASLEAQERARDRAALAGTSREPRAPSAEGILLPAEGTCLRVRARVERISAAAQHEGEQDIRVTVFLHGDGAS